MKRKESMIRALITSLAMLFGSQASALELAIPFPSIDGGTLSIAQWSGQPILVVNTASQCAFTHQYRDLQDLFNRYRDQGLIVLAIPSDDFDQELASNAEVKDFCELQFSIDMPMTEITQVKGKGAHPFYQSLKDELGFTPRWNFNKILIGQNGKVVATFGSEVSPTSSSITRQIETLLK
jgi:glutathione peroxidase